MLEQPSSEGALYTDLRVAYTVNAISASKLNAVSRYALPRDEQALGHGRHQ
jgi:hypothetical protein